MNASTRSAIGTLWCADCASRLRLCKTDTCAVCFDVKIMKGEVDWVRGHTAD